MITYTDLPTVPNIGTMFRKYTKEIDPSHKSHNESGKYSTMHHFVTEMCTHVHISVTKWCIVGYGVGALWDLYKRSIMPDCPLLCHDYVLNHVYAPPICKKYWRVFKYYENSDCVMMSLDCFEFLLPNILLCWISYCLFPALASTRPREIASKLLHTILFNFSS